MIKSKSKESLYDKALKAKEEGLPNADFLAGKVIKFLEKQGELMGAAYAAETLGLLVKAMELYEKTENYLLAAYMAEKLCLEKERLNFYNKEMNKLIKNKDLYGAARIAEIAGFFERAVELNCENNDFINAIKTAKENNLEVLLKKIGKYAIEDFSMEGEFKYAGYAAEAIGEHEKAKDLYKKAIKIYEDKHDFLLAFILREIAGLPHTFTEEHTINEKQPLTLTDSIDTNTCKEIKDLFQLEIDIQEHFGLTEIAKKTKEKALKLYFR